MSYGKNGYVDETEEWAYNDGVQHATAILRKAAQSRSVDQAQLLLKLARQIEQEA